MEAVRRNAEATQLKVRALIDSWDAITGNATLRADPIKGVRKALKVVASSTTKGLFFGIISSRKSSRATRMADFIFVSVAEAILAASQC